MNIMKTNRRSFISTTIFGSFAAPLFAMDLGSQLASRIIKKDDPFRGIFPIMQTPFREDGEIDLEVLRKEVNFIIAAGAHGMAWPQLASEFYVLSDEERLATAEAIVSEVNGRLPVIIGVQSTNYWKVALKFAKHAESIGADGIISLPPFMSNPTVEASVQYYENLAKTVDIPVFIQNSGGRWGSTMPTDMVVELGSKFPQTFYVKEEGDPVTHRIGAMIDKGKDVLNGVFSGGDGTTLLNELMRGCAGSMTGVGMVDIYAKIFNSYTEGKKKQAQEMFDKMMAFQMFKRTAGWLPTEKAVLKERGIFRNTKMRISPYDLEWDEVDMQEFQILFERLKPYFEVRN